MPGPDPKPVFRKGNRARRIVDHPAIVGAKLRFPWCAACGTYGGDGHHALPKDRGGDDRADNIVVLCGSGTSGCHGAHHGSPTRTRVLLGSGFDGPTYTMELRDAEWVNRRIGQHLQSERPDVIAYILGKLGQAQGRVFLADTYHLDLPIE